MQGRKEGDSWYGKSTLQVGTPGTLADYSQQSRDADLAPGQQSHHLQSSMNPGVIGRRSVTDLGAIGDNLTPALGREHFAAQHEALEHAYRNLPLPKDSERPKSYTPVTTCSTLLFCLRFCLFC
jgi:CCR4-NOT transcription complex subunit 3